MPKPIFRMTRNELRDELHRRQQQEAHAQAMLVAAFNKISAIERTIDNTFYKFNSKKLSA